MKKLLLTCALVGAVAASALAQGTVQFSNSTLSRLSLAGVGQIPLTESINIGLFYGIGQSTSLEFLSGQLGINSTSAAGIITNPNDRKSLLQAVQIPGSSPNQDNIWIQYKAWDASFGTDWLTASTAGKWYGMSAIKDIGPLGPATGPGVATWQSSAGVALTTINAFTIAAVPEPSMMALAGLGLASLLIFRRRK